MTRLKHPPHPSTSLPAADAPLSAAAAVRAQQEYAALRLRRGVVYGVRYRPESGRNQLCRFQAGEAQPLLPESFSVRSRVHEYGGGAWCLAGDIACFVNDSDQQIWQLGLDNRVLLPLTDRFDTRFADLQYDARCQRLIAIGEQHLPGQEAINRLVAVDRIGQVSVLAEGADFYSSPALSPDGCRLAWVEWDHPQQPWRCTRLMLAELPAAGGLDNPRQVSDCTAAWVQPRFAPDGTLHAVVDRDDWWRIERFDGQRFHALPGTPPAATEFASAPWQFGLSSYGWNGRGELLAVGQCNGFSGLYRHDGSSWQRLILDLPATCLHALAVEQDTQACVAEFGDRTPGIVLLEPERVTRSNRCPAEMVFGGSLPSYPVSLPEAHSAPLASAPQLSARVSVLASEQISEWAAETQEEPASGRIPYFLYRPLGGAAGPRPLIVYTHGGPTATTAPLFKPALQYWTQRGFLVADVNYRGSTGYGREYRLALGGRWGVSDVEDVEAVARHLVEQGLADGSALFIRGNSAGGYTTLSALTHSRLFRAGTSLYGVSDPARLNELTHKFESHYLHWLIGDPHSDAERYRQRAPLYNADAIAVSVLFFQGEQDRVVLPEQTRQMVQRLRERDVPVQAHYFDDEGHGFRHAVNQQRVLETELDFYLNLGAVKEP